MEKQDWAVDAAIGVFSNARAPGIYKSDYILELFKRYDEEENAFEAPPLPDWCFEDADQDDTDLGHVPNTVHPPITCRFLLALKKQVMGTYYES